MVEVSFEWADAARLVVELSAFAFKAAAAIFAVGVIVGALVVLLVVLVSLLAMQRRPPA